jgi:hypothetical protein
MKNDINAGRKGCGCASESNELMQFNGILPNDCEHVLIPGQVLPKGDDFQKVLQPDNLLVLVS